MVTGNRPKNIVLAPLNLIGTDGNDTLLGMAGDDTLSGAAGTDWLQGGKGNDSLEGGAGNDLLEGGQGNDILAGGEDNDLLSGGSGNDSLDGGTGDDVLDGGQGADLLAGGEGNDILFGGQGGDSLDGGEGSDLLIAGSGEDAASGGAGNDLIDGGAGRDDLDGGEGDDGINGGSGRDLVRGGEGNDLLFGGSGGDWVLGGAGNDAAGGGAHHDYVDGGEGNDTLGGGTGDDMLWGDTGDDSLNGEGGNDAIGDGYGDDLLRGGGGNDTLANFWGSDTLTGDAGNDRIVSFSDAGEPVPAQDPSGQVEAGEPLENSDDVLSGGAGADTFWFHITIDAKQEIIDKYTDANTGRVDWAGVTGENNDVHDHWVESIGDDVITDFRKKQGDKIAIEGHTVEVTSVEQIDANGDGKRDYTLITLISQQGAAGAHDEDQLGTIKVFGDIVTADDIYTHAHPNFGIDTYEGKIAVFGTLGDDEIVGRRGAQALYGGEGEDTLISYSDGGEPVPAQDAGGKVYAYDPAAPADDVLIGGHGNDEFVFRLLLNGRQEILDKHRCGGKIDWQGVTGENNNVHDHWVEGIGNDVIYDFDSGGDGEHADHIKIEGHTVTYTIEHFDTVSAADTDDEVDYSVITLRSDQGAAGAHDEDILGTITVYGDLVEDEDIHLHDHVYYGIDMLEGAIA
jgi:Ca2+-binding RTX toxin-like protein